MANDFAFGYPIIDVVAAITMIQLAGKAKKLKCRVELYTASSKS